MKKLTELISEKVSAAFEQCGYDGKYGTVRASDRPDLCEYQCSGALAAKKEYAKPPRTIAEEVAAVLASDPIFQKAECAGPGFVNLDLSGAFLADYMSAMTASDRLGIEPVKKPKTIILDYGGANVAKPLHVGHLRAAIIGESIKRILRFHGHRVIGDVHLGDWGFQMGLIITRLQELMPDLVYFDESYEGAYPEEAPFDISALEKIYPEASAKSKTDEAFRAKAMKATGDLQNGRRGYRALWQHIMKISVADLKKNYDRLNVEFDLWKGESDVQPYIGEMLRDMQEHGYAYEDDGALIVDVAEESDTKEVPPCIVRKSDGASLYTTTDLATILERMKLYSPDSILYVVDKRQEMHFVQVFRCARKTRLVRPETELRHLGFGTMNGKDGKPFKTREGGVMRLEDLIRDIEAEMLRKIEENRGSAREGDEEVASIVGLSAIKYGDLSNQAAKDYVFDMDRFTSFEGNTGPYILYTIVRIKSILTRYQEAHGDLPAGGIQVPASAGEKQLMLSLSDLLPAFENACAEYAPHKICAYIYELANRFNHFYHETRILTEPDPEKRESWISLLVLVKRVLELCIDLLGFSAPEKM